MCQTKAATASEQVNFPVYEKLDLSESLLTDTANSHELIKKNAYQGNLQRSVMKLQAAQRLINRQTVNNRTTF